MEYIFAKVKMKLTNNAALLNVSFYQGALYKYCAVRYTIFNELFTLCSRSILCEWIANMRQIPKGIALPPNHSPSIVFTPCLKLYRTPFINMYRMWIVNSFPIWREYFQKYPIITCPKTPVLGSSVILLLLMITTTAMQLQWHRIWLWTCINWVEFNLWMKFHDRVSLCFCGVHLSCVKQIISSARSIAIIPIYIYIRRLCMKARSYEFITF